MRAGIIKNAVRYGICRRILMDDTGFSMGTAPWSEEMSRQFEDVPGVNENAEFQNEVINDRCIARTLSTALRFGLCRQILFDDGDISTETVPWTQDMLQRIEALTYILALRDSHG